MLIVTSSGGSAIIATDVAADNGFRISPLPAALASRLREFLPSHFIVGNPLDLTGDGTAELFRRVIATARALMQAIDDMAGVITGDREYFYGKPHSLAQGHNAPPNRRD